MKKVLLIAMSFIVLEACSNNEGQTGIQQDGMKLGDTNGGLADTSYNNQSATDTAKMEHRVDVSTRDTFDNKNNR